MKFLAGCTFTYPSQPVEGEGIFAPQGTPTKLIQVLSAALYFAGAWEVMVSLFFLAAGVFCLLGRRDRVCWNAIPAGLFMGASTFVAMSLFDII